MLIESRLFSWEAADVVEGRTGIRLASNALTGSLVTHLDPSLHRRCVLFGPYRDLDGDPELRIFVSVSEMDGCKTTLQLLVQDCEDDWLNSTAQGAEKYDVGCVTV